MPYMKNHINKYAANADKIPADKKIAGHILSSAGKEYIIKEKP